MFVNEGVHLNGLCKKCLITHEPIIDRVYPISGGKTL